MRLRPILKEASSQLHALIHSEVKLMVEDGGSIIVHA